MRGGDEHIDPACGPSSVTQTLLPFINLHVFLDGNFSECSVIENRYLRNHYLLGQPKPSFYFWNVNSTHGLCDRNYRKILQWLVLTPDATCDQKFPLCLPKVPRNRGPCFVKLGAEPVIFLPLMYSFGRVTADVSCAFCPQITAKAAIVFVALQYNVTRPATGRSLCRHAIGQIGRYPWTLKSMLISSVWAFFYPKQGTKPGLMCWLFLIYFVHGLEIPSETSLYCFL